MAPLAFAERDCRTSATGSQTGKAQSNNRVGTAKLRALAAPVVDHNTQTISIAMRPLWTMATSNRTATNHAIAKAPRAIHPSKLGRASFQSLGVVDFAHARMHIASTTGACDSRRSWIHSCQRLCAEGQSEIITSIGRQAAMRLEASTARHRLRIAPETKRNGNERSILTKDDRSRFQRAEPFRLFSVGRAQKSLRCGLEKP